MSMKTRVLILILALSWTLGSCAPSTHRTLNPGPMGDSVDPSFLSQSPCDDSLYVALRARSLDDMSAREYEYFLQRDASCAEFERAEASVPIAPDKATLGAREGFIMLALVAVFGFLAYGYGM